MSIFASAGAAVGLVIGLIIAVIIFKFANTDHRTKTEYDERQKGIRGQAYMYAFYTMLIYECLMMIVEIGNISVPFDRYLIHFLGIYLGCTVLGCYSIWHGVYWGLNNDPRRYAFVFAVIGIVNIIPIIMAFRNGDISSKGINSLPYLNVMVLTMLLIFGIVICAKHFSDKREAEMEE